MTTVSSTPHDTKRPRHAVFAFTDLILSGHTLSCYYALTGGPDADVLFCEQLEFPTTLAAPDANDPLVARLLQACHFMLGISYYKAAIPPQIDAPPLPEAEAAFWDILYTEGLGEFYCRNGLTFPPLPLFPRLSGTPEMSAVHEETAENATNYGNVINAQQKEESALILIGGGKDSAVVADIVVQSGVAAAALSFGRSQWAERSAAAAGLTLHSITRQISPNLLRLNEQGAWNGHIPISACIAVVSTLVAYANGFSAILAGNERGAEEATVIEHGYAYNHQWSKTLRFEHLWQAWCRSVSQRIPHYFSLLRPLSELQIAQQFALLPQHWSEFTSCNSNFRQTPQAAPRRWCGTCPKCVFVYLLLSPFLTDQQLAEIFQQNVLQKESVYLPMLLGLTDAKPWECVGTRDECRLALTALYRQQRCSPVLLDLIKQHPQVLLSEQFEAMWQHEMTPQAQHALTTRWWSRLNHYLSAE